MAHTLRSLACLSLCASVALAQQQQQPPVQLNTPVQQAPAPLPGQPASTGTSIQQVGDSTSQSFTLRVDSNMVLTNVVVRDKKTGVVIKDLKASDFTILENNKAQKISSFDYQTVDQAARLNEATVSGKAPTIAQILDRSMGADQKQLRDHRLIVMFFDLSSMQDEDIDRAVDAAKDYINKKMAPADLVAVASLSTSLSLDHDFTADKDQLLRTVSKFNGTNEGAGFANGATADTDVTSEDGTGFTADDTEYNNLNTDRQLYAIQTIAKSLEKLEQHKSMLYFSGGLTRQGIENQASMRAATNEAVKANMAIYSVDSRGLEALSPLGDASTGSLRGTSAYSGRAMQSRLDSNFASQETLGTLASDTGGKFFSDSNDFAPAFAQIQHDTEAYYILGFRSTDQRRDGAFRHLTVKLNNHPDAKLEYRPGYYAPADFKHQKTEDREYALNEQLKSDLPAVDISMYLEAFYFRVSPNEYYIPMSLIVPGSQIPFTRTKDQDKATLDIVGQVKNAQGIAVGNARETIKLSVDGTLGAARRNIQYSTGFTLAPGHYHVKFVARENETGNMGSFETDLVVPDQRKQPIKLSSVVLSSQRTPAAQQPRHPGPMPPGMQAPVNPLVQDGQLFVPNVPHVFRQDAHLYLLYELYDPAKAAAVAQQQAATEANAKQSGMKARPTSGGIHVLTSIEFLQNGAKVFETPLVAAETLNEPERGAVGFSFDVPLETLKPGTYICQVNVVDDTAGTFTFPRLAVKVVAPIPTAAPANPATPAAPTSTSGAPAGN
ncbi:VWA domain-containing protein [Terriglobus roseus]|uniref:VWFA-related domain-containing protein n=1 Tax=Terriglobus roseus TaxID=392734 RepID=A0A1G7Q064_9BACT|nr:VWA domain-containing protein [Terriglobus roseus]SDF91942.1 VWFA-related domain-containing protein [Terriglobus roseus]